jgi:hypothetical protein
MTAPGRSASVTVEQDDRLLYFALEPVFAKRTGRLLLSREAGVRTT